MYDRLITMIIDAVPFKPQDIITQASALGFYGSVISFLSGFVYLAFGWRIFKIMVVIIFGFLGFYLGATLGNIIDFPATAGIIGGLLFALCSLPLMRLFSGITIAALTTLIIVYGWQLLEMPQKYMLPCALAALVIGILCGHYMFRLAIIGYTSLLGASMIIAGFLGFLMATEPDNQALTNPTERLVAIFLGAIALLGIFLQYQIQGKTDKKRKSAEE